MARRVVELVPPHVMPHRILDAGCGTGAGLSLARSRWPSSRITGIDIAPGMIRCAAETFTNDRQLDLVVADLMRYEPAGRFDAIISSSALHWIRPFEHCLVQLAGMLNDGGCLAVGVMLDGTLSELRSAREAVVPDKIPRVRLPSFDDLQHAARLVRGARVRRIEQSVNEIDFDDAWTFLRSIHAMGVTGGDISGHSHPLTRRELQNLAAWYDLHANAARGVRATFVTGYVMMET